MPKEVYSTNLRDQMYEFGNSKHYKTISDRVCISQECISNSKVTVIVAFITWKFGLLVSLCSSCRLIIIVCWNGLYSHNS